MSPLPCQTPVALDCDTASNDSNATDGADSQDLWDGYGCNGFDYSGSEVVYTFTPAADGDYAVELSNMTADADVVILQACDPSGCLAASTSASSSTDSLTATLTGGVDYWIVVDGYDGAQTGFDLVVACGVCTDDDLDGFCVEDDCDDGDPSVWPGAPETCGDGVDQDCSGADLPCPSLCDPSTEVEFGTSCYYLDGSRGLCDPGFILAPQSVLQFIAADFIGKTYKHTVSNNCCIVHANQSAEGQDWGMTTQCNSAGPFTAGNPELGGAGCTDVQNDEVGQLTFCMTGVLTDSDGDGDPDSTDCDDADPTVYTGAPEACDFVDSDCDGSLVDTFPDWDGDLEPDCTDTDDDNDGIIDSTDCDDFNPSIYNGAPEVCGDGVDQDCDGSDLPCAILCDPSREVEYAGTCYYLDGSQGACDAGYSLAPQSILNTIAPMFVGKDYKHTVSSNCCITHADQAAEGQDWGMTTECNSGGPFTSGNPQWGGAGCIDQQNDFAGQLTLCQSGASAASGGYGLDLTPSSGSLIQVDDPYWANKGYRFTAEEDFGINGFSWWIDMPSDGYVRASVYSASGALLGRGTTTYGDGTEQWLRSDLDFEFVEGTQYTIAMYTNRAASSLFDRMDSPSMGYGVEGFVSGVQGRSAAAGDDAPETFPVDDNTWAPFQIMHVATLDITPETGSPVDTDDPYWANKGYRFVANETFSITGGAWWITMPSDGFVRLNIYDVGGALLASGSASYGSGVEQWIRSDLAFTFVAGNTYTASFYTNRAASSLFDRMDGATAGYGVTDWMSALQSRSAASGDDALETFPIADNSWWPVQRLDFD